MLQVLLLVGIACLFALPQSGVCTPAGAENLLRNPGFEQIDDGQAPGWEVEASEVQYVQDPNHSGEWAARFVDPAPNENIHLFSEAIPARPAGTYTATAWFRTNDECQPGLYINFFNDLNQRIHHKYSRADGPTDGWQQVTVTTVAPARAITVRCSLYAFLGDTGTFEADDVTLTVTGGRPPLDIQLHAQPGDTDMVNIGSRRELFVDSFLLDDIDGDGRRLLHHPVRREIALQVNKPWEGTTAAYVAVMRDGDTIRLYYRGEGCTCMAESSDGIHFTRPNLGLFEWEGSKDNNIVWKGPGTHNFTPFRDPNPQAPENQRYKALGSSTQDGTRGLLAFSSPDGIHWQLMQKEHVITDGAFDSQNLAFWDPMREKYVEYHRDFRNGVRDIRTCTSDDFIHWTDPEWLDYGDAPPEHLYTNAVIPYFRAPHIYLGFPNRFVPGRTKVAEHSNKGINDAVLMSSRDGLHFERWQEAWLRPSTDPKTWTDRNNYVAWNMVPTSDSEISMYANEHYRYPTQRLRRLTIRTDGFVSLHGGAEGAEAITRPLTFAGSRLVINYETSTVGSVRVGLCDESGEAYPGFGLADCPAIFGNEIAHTVSWENGSDVTELAGKPVRLRLRVRDADIYSFQFTDDEGDAEKD